ncbi:multidrug transporter [Marinosulfonomonas sp. PRT-SC04]|nr:multidrug transporter [Marinosulfonomonas sp. PRT-SC04]
MSDWVAVLQGTPAGHQVAMGLALLSAVLHAFFGALQKGRHDPWLTRGAIDISYGLIAAPFALFVVPWPEPHMWLIFIGAFVIHCVYKYLQAMAYVRGAYTVVYPVVRGTGPLFAIVGAYLLFDERFSARQWAGVAVLLAGIYGLALYNLRTVTVGRETIKMALVLAVLTGLTVSTYTTYDAYAIRASTDPFTFLAWFFMLDGLFFMPTIAAFRYRAMVDPPDLGPLMMRGLIGGVIAIISFGGIILATRLANVGQVAVLRETSTVFAALIGWLVLKEQIGPRRFLLMALIALGAVIVGMGK